jgi:hypothetical protein
LLEREGSFEHMPRRVLALVVLTAVSIGGGALYLTGRADDGSPIPEPSGPEERTLASNDPIERACALPQEQLVRLWRGHHRIHSEDVTTVPLEPNYSGAFTVTSHSGPWDYVQTIPLTFYGPTHIASNGRLDEEASITDVYPTVAHLTQTELDKRAGEDLMARMSANETEPPKLIVTVVWDGVGRNVLDRWEGRWPNLSRLESEGTSFLKATVGSSPSITPATHTSLGTGDFPYRHGVTAIEYRTKEGKVRGAFAGKNPADAKLTTFGDEIDKALNNEPKVGMLAWKSWHLGMLGHGSQTPGGDKDELALIAGLDGHVVGNSNFYSTPKLSLGPHRLEDIADELDRSDGKADEEWRGHVILEEHDNPAWVDYQSEMLIEMLSKGGYGTDDIPDLFFTNFKISDIVAHQYGMDSEEEGDVIEAQDAALGALVDWLDTEVGDYVVVMTADHGNTHRAELTGAWPIGQGELREDVDAEFNVPKDLDLVDTSSAAGPFLDRAVARQLGVTASDVAEFSTGYTIAENNSRPELPEGYEDRGDENVFSAAFATDQYDEIMQCAFGTTRPPEGFRA